MTRQEAVTQLKDLKNSYDTESAHGEADMILCILLQTLGYGDVVQAWSDVKKWYARPANA